MNLKKNQTNQKLDPFNPMVEDKVVKSTDEKVVNLIDDAGQ